MAKKQSFIISNILELIAEMSEILPLPLETPYSWMKRQRGFRPARFYSSIFELKSRGAVQVYEKNNKKFIKLTKKGQLELLLSKARIPIKGQWDGKWRVVIFDIPEGSKQKRHFFRHLLLQNNFKKLQASVYVSPYALNRAAVDYLETSGLIDYIRIMRVDDIGDDKMLRKKFDLSK